MNQATPHEPGPGPEERDGAVLDRRTPPPGPRPTTGGPRHAPHPLPSVPPGRPPYPPTSPPTSHAPGMPPGMPRQAPPGHGQGGYPPPTGGWAPLADGPYDPYDTEDPRAPGNPAAVLSVVLAVLALLVSLRPLAFGSMALSWDGVAGIVVALVAVLAGAVGLRTAVLRPVAAVGMVLAVAALLVVAVLPTF